MNLSSKLRCKDKHNICNNAAYHKKIVALVYFFILCSVFAHQDIKFAFKF